MRYIVLLLTLLASAAWPDWSEADGQRFRRAIGRVWSESLPDNAIVRDHMGFTHQVKADSLGLWYRTSEPYRGQAGRAPAIRITKEQVTSPLLLLVRDELGAASTPVLVVLWNEQDGTGARVLFCARRLDRQFCIWSKLRDVTPKLRAGDDKVGEK